MRDDTIRRVVLKRGGTTVPKSEFLGPFRGFVDYSSGLTQIFYREIVNPDLFLIKILSVRGHNFTLYN